VFLLVPVCGFSDEIKLDDIVVTGSYTQVDSSNTARVVDVVSSTDNGFIAAGDVSQLVGDFTSVDISDYGSAAASKQIRLRGSTSSQVLVMVDGRPVNNPRDGAIDLNTIALDNVDKIELLHGAGSSLYGSSAMGGVVNIITKAPPKAGQKTEFLTTFGTYRTYYENLTHGAKIGKFGYLLSGGYKSSEGHRDNSAYNAKDFNSKFEYEFAVDNKLGINCGFYRDKLGAPGSLAYPSISDNQTDLKKYVDLNWDVMIDDSLGFSAKAYDNYDRMEYSTYDKYVYTTKWSGLDFSFNKQVFDFYSVVAGFNYVLNRSNTNSSGKHKYNVRAGYVENNFDFFEKLRFSLNGRWDDYSNFGAEFNPSLSFLYRFTIDTKLHGSIGRAFRVPTFNDLYYVDMDGNVCNPSLKPEKGLSMDIGIDNRFNKYFSAGITYYHNSFNDMIDWDTNNGVSTVSNMASAQIHGVELAGKIYPLEKLELGFGYTFLYAKNDKTDKYLIYRPVNKYDLSVQVKDLVGFTFGVKGKFYGRRYSDSDNTARVKRHFIMDFDLEKKFNERFTYLFSIDNLLNKHYEAMRGYPMPGFAVTSGVKFIF